MTTQTSSVEERLASLERSRRLAWVLTGAIATVAVMLGADKASDLSTRSLTITDAAGKKRIWLGTETEAGIPRIRFYDKADKVRLSLMVNKAEGDSRETGAISFVRDDEKSALVLGESEDKSGFVELAAINGDDALTFNSPKSGKERSEELTKAFSAIPKMPLARRPPMKPRRSSPSDERVASSLVLTDLTMSPSSSGNYVEVNGRVLNNTGDSIPSLKVGITYENASGRLIMNGNTVVAPNPLPAGSVGTFTGMDRMKPGIDHVKLNFDVFAGPTVPWVDRSGTNAHQ